MRENLKAARKAKGMTQQQTAEAIGLSLIGYQQIERGVRIGENRDLGQIGGPVRGPSAGIERKQLIFFDTV